MLTDSLSADLVKLFSLLGTWKAVADVLCISQVHLCRIKSGSSVPTRQLCSFARLMVEKVERDAKRKGQK